MPYLIASVVAVLVVGIALGWFLRKKERWCSACGGDLVCLACAQDATAARTRQPRRGEAATYRRSSR